MFCHMISSTLKIAGMRWKVIGSSNSMIVASAMASHAIKDRTCHASHAGLISQDSSADAAAS